MLHILNVTRPFRRRNGRLESRPHWLTRVLASSTSSTHPGRHRSGRFKPSRPQDPTRRTAAGYALSTSEILIRAAGQSIASLADSTAS